MSSRWDSLKPSNKSGSSSADGNSRSSKNHSTISSSSSSSRQQQSSWRSNKYYNTMNNRNHNNNTTNYSTNDMNSSSNRRRRFPTSSSGNSTAAAATTTTTTTIPYNSQDYLQKDLEKQQQQNMEWEKIINTIQKECKITDDKNISIQTTKTMINESIDRFISMINHSYSLSVSDQKKRFIRLMDMLPITANNNNNNNNNNEYVFIVTIIFKLLHTLLLFQPAQSSSISSTTKDGIIVKPFQFTNTIEASSYVNLLANVCHTLMMMRLNNHKEQQPNNDCSNNDNNKSPNNNNNDIDIVLRYGIKCLAKTISVSVKYLPPEDTARDVISRIILPTLLHIKRQRQEEEVVLMMKNDPFFISSLLDSLHFLLLNSNHASALLGPLVYDITNEGKEHQVINPLRQQIFQSIQIWFDTSIVNTILEEQRQQEDEEVQRKSNTATTSTTNKTYDRKSQNEEEKEKKQPIHFILQSACRALETALYATHKLDVTTTSNSTTTTGVNDIDLSLIERYLSRILALSSSSSSIMTKSFYDHISNSNSRNSTILLLPTLNMLLALLQRYPDVSARIATRVLFINPNYNRIPQQQQQQYCNSSGSRSNVVSERCPTCLYYLSELAPLIRLFHNSSTTTSASGMKASTNYSFSSRSYSTIDTNDNNNDDYKINVLCTVIDCITKILDNAPLHVWIGGGGPSSPSSMQRKPTSTTSSIKTTISGFRRTIIESLEMIFKVTICRFRCLILNTNNDNKTIDKTSSSFSSTSAINTKTIMSQQQVTESLEKLINILLTKIPFQHQEEEQQQLLNLGCQLWSIVGSLVVLEDDDTTGSTTTGSNSMRNSSQSKFIQDSILRIMINSMGGKITPQGNILPICLPAKLVLSSSSSSSSNTNATTDATHDDTTVSSSSSSTTPIFFHRLQVSFDSNKQRPTENSFNNSKTKRNMKNNDISSNVKILRAMLRSRPETALDHWEWFQQLVQNYCFSNDSDFQLVGYELLEGFLLGRKDFGTNDMDVKNSILLSTKEQSVLIGPLICSVLPKSKSARSKTTAISPTIASVQSRCVIFNVYSALLHSDWYQMMKIEGTNRLLYHINRILSHCQKPSSSSSCQEEDMMTTDNNNTNNDCIEISIGESNSKVRSAACKAIADMCAQCLWSVNMYDDKDAIDDTFTEDLSKTICENVCETMLISIEDSNSSVRSMALFALGNLAHSILGGEQTTHYNHAKLIEVSTLQRVSVAAQRYIQDSNDKVSGNAIRSIGHLGRLLFRHPDAYQPKEGIVDESAESNLTFNQGTFFELVIQSLSNKLSDALLVATNGNKQNLSWKQRSVAKRYGRGTCNALALLLKSTTINEEVFQGDSGIVFQGDSGNGENIMKYSSLTSSSCLREVVRLLISCVEEASRLHEKFAVAAMSALLALEPGTLFEVGDRTGVVGNGIIACTLHLIEGKSQVRPISQKIKDESELLLRHLLLAASILDACVVLKSDEISKSTLEFLYVWMVETEVDGRSFEIFALASQRPGLRMDVSLEQNFSSRALQHYKRDQPKPSDNCGDEETTDNYFEDGADEL